jgi:hypothetical protein
MVDGFDNRIDGLKTNVVSADSLLEYLTEEEKAQLLHSVPRISHGNKLVECCK